MAQFAHDPGTARLGKTIALALLFTLAAAGVLSASGGRDIVFKTQWKDRDLVIDGRNSDWQGALGYLDEPLVSLGFLNDESAVYVCLATNTPALREGMLRRGITVWIDPSGGKKKILGIRLAPVDGPERNPPSAPPKGEAEKPGEPAAPPEAGGRPEFGAPPTRLMVRLPGREQWVPVEAGGANGIEAAVDESNGLAVFEMKVPMIAGPEAPFALGAAPGKAIAMSFETPKPERPAGRPGGPPGDAGERLGRRGGFDGPPSSAFGGPGGHDPGMEDPFKGLEGLKLRVEMKLAVKPS